MEGFSLVQFLQDAPQLAALVVVIWFILQWKKSEDEREKIARERESRVMAEWQGWMAKEAETTRAFLKQLQDTQVDVLQQMSNELMRLGDRVELLGNSVAAMKERTKPRAKDGGVG